MPKLRSPNYPSQSLEEAYTRVRDIYNKEHTHPAPREVVAQDLGYKGLNGSALAAIGALSRYGLLEKVGKEGLRVTDDAVTVLELEEGVSLRFEALKRLAFMPVLFAELKERFGDNLPSDVNLRHFLIQQKAFLPKAADEVIRIYKKNLELVSEQQETYDEGASTSEKPGERTPMNAPTPTTRQVAAAPSTDSRAKSGVYEFSFPLSFQRDVKAVVTIYGDKLQRRDLEFLKRKVGDLLDGFEDELAKRETASTDESEGSVKGVST